MPSISLSVFAFLLEKRPKSPAYIVGRGPKNSTRLQLNPGTYLKVGDEVLQYRLSDGSILLKKVVT